MKRRIYSETIYSEKFCTMFLFEKFKWRITTKHALCLKMQAGVDLEDYALQNKILHCPIAN